MSTPHPLKQHGRRILVLAVPALFTNAAEPLLSLVDTAILGRTGVAGMAGSAIAANLFHQVYWVANFLPLGMSANVSQLDGAGDRPRAVLLALKTALISGLAGLMAGVVLLAVQTPLFDLYRATPDVREISSGFYILRMLGLCPALMNVCLASYLQGVLDTRTPMAAILTGAAMNAALDFLLVFGWGGWQGMGVTGAGAAHFTAQWVCNGLLWMGFLRSLKQRDGTPIPLPSLTEIRNMPMKFISGVGIDLFLRSVSLNLVFFVGMVLSARLGKAHVAAHNVVMQLWFFAAHSTDALAIAARSLTGQSLGAGDRETAYEQGRTALRLGLLAGVGQLTVFGLLHQVLPRLFTPETAVLAVVALPYWVFVASQPVNCVSFVLDGVLKGAGDAAFLRQWLMVAGFLGFMPLALLLTPARHDLLGIWLGLALMMAIRTGSIVSRFYSRKWLFAGERVFDLGKS